MAFFDHKLTEIAEKIMEHIDLEEVTAEVLSKLTVTDLELFFVVRDVYKGDWPAPEGLEFVGMAYSEETANILWAENSKASPCKIMKMDLDRAMTLAREVGILEEVA